MLSGLLETMYPIFLPQNIKNMFHRTVYDLLAQEDLCRVWRKISIHNKVIVLMYHEVLKDEQQIDAWTFVRESDFRRQIEYLNREFEVVSLHEALNSFNHPLPSKKSRAVITFDDGYSGNLHNVLPIVESLGIPITIFVTTKNVQEQRSYWFDEVIFALQSRTVHTEEIESILKDMGCTLDPDSIRGEERWDYIERVLGILKKLDPIYRQEIVDMIIRGKELVNIYCRNIRPMTIDEVRKISDSPLVTIGAHTHCHSILNQLSRVEAEITIRTSKALLQEWTGKNIQYFAYPNGDYSADVMQTVKDAGFSCALTTEPCPWNKKHNLFAIPRIGIGRYDSFRTFKARVSGF